MLTIGFDRSHTRRQIEVSPRRGSMGKTYFLSANLDYPPSSSISLGSIWTNPADPGTCINRDGPLPFPSNMPIEKSWKTDWVNERDRQRKGLIGIWARFLQVVGVDAEVSVNWDKIKASKYKFDRLDTEFVDPTPKYVQESVLSEPVAQFIAASDFKKPIYMITGIKIARGADVALAKSKEAGAHVRAGVDGTPAGTPVAAGPEVTISSKDSEKTSYGGSSDFVFAYRLRKIFYEKGQVRDDEYNKGALYGLGDWKADEMKADPSASTLEVIGLAKVDASAKGPEFREEPAIDEYGEEQCNIVKVVK